MKNAEVYQLVTDRLLFEIGEGNIPWRKPWRSPEGFSPIAVSHATGRFYRGINAFLLPPGEYVTFKGARAEGGSVRKGERGFQVVFWKLIESKSDTVAVPQADGSVKQVGKVIPLLRFYTVFELSQCEGLKRRHSGDLVESEMVPDEVWGGYKNPPQLAVSPDRAFYRAADDLVCVPHSSQFDSMDEYFSTFYHELVHSTGHASRLNRLGFMDSAAFASGDYSFEELVAEFGAAMLCAVSGVDNDAVTVNQGAYLRGWLDALSGDTSLAVRAASAAQKAVDHILGVTFDSKSENGEESK